MRNSVKDAAMAVIRDDQVQRSVNAIYWRQMGFMLKIAIAYYCLFFVSHYFFFEGIVRAILMGLAATAVAVSVLTLLYVDKKKFRSSAAPWIFVPTGLMIIINVYVHVFITQDQLQLTNGVLALVAFGVTILHFPLFVILTSISAALYLAALAYVPGPYGAHFAFMFAGGLALAVVSFRQRYNTIRSEVSLSLLNRSRVRALSRLNDEVREKAEEAERANKAKSDFLANTTHELRTPLTGIMGMLDLMRATDMDHEQIKLINTAHTTSQSLLVLINDILDISRLSEGKLQLQKKTFSPVEIIRTVETLLRPKAEEKGLVLSVSQLPPKDLMAHGDPVRISQILLNLVGNAIKFTPEGRVVIDLQVSATQDIVHLTYTVVDTGIGISQEDQRRLFERFERADSSKTTDQDGAGLGLAISRYLVDLMEGSLTVKSTPGHGSAFSFTVSAQAVDEISIEEPALFEAGADVISDRSLALKVLVAEDNPVNQMLIQKILKHDGWDIVMTGNGEEALSQLKSNQGQFDLVLLDIRMPKMNGVDAVKAIRALETNDSALPVIALTANTADDDVATYLSSGFDDVVAKPIDMEILLAAITKVAG